MSDLVLHLKAEYWDQIAQRRKRYEYRAATPYWCRRIMGRRFDRIILYRGYPRRDDASRRLERPWRGYTMDTVDLMDLGPTCVFVFRVNP